MKIFTNILKSSALRFMIVIVATLFFVDYSQAQRNTSISSEVECVTQQKEDTQKSLWVNAEEQEEEENEEQSNTIVFQDASFQHAYSIGDTRNVACKLRSQAKKEESFLYIRHACLKIP